MLVGMMRMARFVEDTSRVTKNLVAALEAARRRLPTAGQTRVQQLSVRRLPTPDGDRRHSAQSGSVVNEVPPLKRHQNIVRVLVLREDGLNVDGRALRPAPIQDLLEGGLRSNDRGEASARGTVEVGVIDEWRITHWSFDTLGAPNGWRLSCGAELEYSQTEFYNTGYGGVSGSVEDGRRQLQARVRQHAGTFAGDR